MLCTSLSFPYITAVASKRSRMDILCTGCLVHSGLSNSATDLWGGHSFEHKCNALLRSLANLALMPTHRNPIHFEETAVKFFLPFPHLHVSTFLTLQDVLARIEMTRKRSRMGNIEMGTAVTTGSLQCHHYPKKKGCAFQSKKEHLASDYSSCVSVTLMEYPVTWRTHYLLSLSSSH